MNRIWLMAAIAALGIAPVDYADAGLRCCRGVVRTVERVAQQTGRVVGNPRAESIRILADAQKSAERAAKEAAERAARESTAAYKAFVAGLAGTAAEAERTGQNIGAAATTAREDAVAEAGRALANTEELLVAGVHWVETTVADAQNQAKDAEQRIREGKFADAYWHAVYNAQIRDPEAKMAALVQESSAANTLAQVGAAAYVPGGGGSAAYAAWYTYNQTKDPQMALKVGLIAGATSAGLSQVSGLPVSSETVAGDMAKKAVLAGAIGGLAVAAGGGDETALREGFLRTGGMVLVQDGYRQILKDPVTGETRQNLVQNSKVPSQGGFCTAADPLVAKACSPSRDLVYTNDKGQFVDPNGKVLPPGKAIMNMSKFPSDHSAVGLASSTNAGNWFYAETGGLMNSVAKLPGANAMAIMHDQWVILGLDGWKNQATILPAVVITYLGTESGIQDHLRDVVIAANEEKNRVPSPVASSAIEQLPTALDPTALDPDLQSDEMLQLLKDPKAVFSKRSYLCTKTFTVLEPQEEMWGDRARTFWKKTQRLTHRSIFVIEGQPPVEFACAVIYQKPEELGVDEMPYYALNEGSFCRRQAASLAVFHIYDGWDCLSR